MTVFDAVTIFILLSACLIFIKLLLWLVDDEFVRIVGELSREFRSLIRGSWSPQSLNALGIISGTGLLAYLLGGTNLKGVVGDGSHSDGLQAYLITIVISALLLMLCAIICVWLTGAKSK